MLSLNVTIYLLFVFIKIEVNGLMLNMDLLTLNK